MWQAEAIKKIVKCELQQRANASEESQWSFNFMRWFIDLALRRSQPNLAFFLLVGQRK